ncbi:MAG TPA: fimbria/pilus periplasmic chaperone [Vicinamibacterales bacterium]|nr:fimbria/pilus periplasmic chaperone [Vicinamibacterales bacterium]
MTTMSRVGGVLSMAVAIAICATAAVETQTTFSIDPLMVELDAANRNAVMTITNTSSKEMRFEIKAFAWDQEPDGAMKLTPTTDVVIFPPLVTLKPKSIQRLRIGTDVPQGAVEKSYRLMIEELPSAAAPAAGTRVAVRTRIGVPVFLAPTKSVRSGRIDQTTVSKGVVTVPMTNTGSIHAMVDEVSVRGMSAPDSPVFEEALKGWYVLAGKTRTWTYTMKPAQCRAVKFLEIEASAHDKVLTQRVELPASACVR